MTSHLSAWPCTPTARPWRLSDYGNRKDKHFSGGVLLLERGTGKIVRELPTPGAPASHATFSLDGRWLAAVAGAAPTSGICEPARK